MTGDYGNNNIYNVGSDDVIEIVNKGNVDLSYGLSDIFTERHPETNRTIHKGESYTLPLTIDAVNWITIKTNNTALDYNKFFKQTDGNIYIGFTPQSRFNDNY